MSELKVVQLPHIDLGDIPAKLRILADDIERGAYGDVIECAVVQHSDKGHQIFCFGRSCDAGTGHLLFAVGMRKFEIAVLREAGEL